MPGIFGKNKFVFEDGDDKHIVLDCNKFINNKSRVSFQRFDKQDFQIVPFLFADCLQRTRASNNETSLVVVM